MVVVATIRALRHHGGAKKEEYDDPSVERVEKGFPNLKRHLENMTKFGITPVVAINNFTSDTDEEIDLVKKRCGEMGVTAVRSEGWAKGGEGMMALAEAVVNSAENGGNDFKPLYDWDMSIDRKIKTIAREIYRASEVEYSPKARREMRNLEDLGLGNLPICMAKTQNSFSDNVKLFGAPEGFTVTVREFEIAAGAGFLIPILGKMMRMPGLPAVPASEGMDIDDDGVITGLS